MITMTQIIAAVITGLSLFLALVAQYVLLSRKRKIEDITGIIIPRRAELYQKLLMKICGTGVQFNYEIGHASPAEKIIFLHEVCNRAIYELSPLCGENALNAVTKLSATCAEFRPKLLAASGEAIEREWQNFKYHFQTYFLDLVSFVRSDCMVPAIDRFVLDAVTRRRVKDMVGYPWKFGRKNETKK